MGFKIIIFSNSGKVRLKPFKEELEVDCAFNCKKPMRKKFDLILKEYKYAISEIVIVGDNIITDVLGGNKVGITTILVNPISNKEKTTTKQAPYVFMSTRALLYRVKLCV